MYAHVLSWLFLYREGHCEVEYNQEVDRRIENALRWACIRRPGTVHLQSPGDKPATVLISHYQYEIQSSY